MIATIAALAGEHDHEPARELHGEGVSDHGAPVCCAWEISVGSHGA